MTTSTDAIDELIQKCQALPPDLQQQVINFVEFLLSKHVTNQEAVEQKGTESEAKPKRILGLHRGQVWMSDNFDAPLPDEFWLGEE
ncbi:MAG: DUF2281 domain-containing protein [Kovacikia sp.]